MTQKASDFTMMRITKKTRNLLQIIKTNKGFYTLEDAIVYLYNERNTAVAELKKLKG